MLQGRNLLGLLMCGALTGAVIAMPSSGGAIESPDSGRFVPSEPLAETWLAPTDGRAALSDETPIAEPLVGGSPAASGQFPWMTFLTIQLQSGGFGTCGGSLIAPRWILTAAHCVDDAVAVGAIVGRTSAPTSLSDPDYVFAARTFVNAGYRPGGIGVADVALVELQETSSARPIYLAKPSDSQLYPAGTMATLTGWGLTSPGGQSSDVLLRGELPIRSNSDCIAAYPGFNATFNTCAGFSSAEAPLPVGGCRGDSGGPLFVRSSNSQSVLQVGTVSGGKGDCTSLAYPGLYMRVSAYYDVIDDLVGGLPEPPTPAPPIPEPPIPAPPAATSPIMTVTPVRLFDSRPIGARTAGSVTEVQVAGRGGVPTDAVGAMLNVTVVEAQGPGFATVFPCGEARPDASNLNYVADQTIPNAVAAKLGAAGSVCIFTNSQAQLLVDVNGYVPAGSDVSLITPARLFDSRPTGPRPGGTLTTVQVAGVGGVPAGSKAAMLNVTVVEAQAPGFATVYPCDQPRPDASNLNYGPGGTIPNAVFAKLSASGTVCVYTYASAHLLVDVNGYVPAGSSASPVNPFRAFDSRATGVVPPGGSDTAVQIAGAGGVPIGSRTAMLNVTVVEAQAPGFATVYPCDQPRPDASNLNYGPGGTIPNAVFAKLSASGTVCVYTYASAHLLVDVNGYVP